MPNLKDFYILGITFSNKAGCTCIEIASGLFLCESQVHKTGGPVAVHCAGELTGILISSNLLLLLVVVALQQIDLVWICTDVHRLHSVQEHGWRTGAENRLHCIGFCQRIELKEEVWGEAEAGIHKNQRY